MLHTARDDWALDLATSWLIGDRWVDVGAAAAAGVRSVLVESPYSWDRAGGAECPEGLVPTLSASDIGTAVDAIVGARSR
jgi:D-glycero-D-manno-heptose 1,7-bisphosphate phosphatase